MSLCNTFRLIAASLVLVGTIFTPVTSFALRRTTTFVNLEDLFQDTSVNLDVKYHAKRPFENKRDTQVKNDVPKITTAYSDSVSNNENDAKVNTDRSDFKFTSTDTKDTNKSTFSEITVPATVKKIKEDYSTTMDAPNTTESAVVQKETLFETNVDSTATSYDAVTETDINYISPTNSDKIDIPSIRKIVGNADSLGHNDVATEDAIYRSNESTVLLFDTKYEDTGTSKNVNVKSTNSILVKPTISSKYSILKSTISPSWKKYTLIDRKRPSTTQDPLTNTNEKDEAIIRAETVQSIFSLQNIITSDIPSLEQLKNDLLSSTTTTLKATQKPIDYSSTLGHSKPVDNPIIDFSLTESLSSFVETSTIEPTNTVESKRAGYLDHTAQNVNKETSMENTTGDLKLVENYHLRDLEPESAERDIVEEKNISRLESQSQLNEDALKEELLKEELISDTEENAMRHEVKIDKDVAQSFPEVPEWSTIATEPQLNESILNGSTEDILKVQPINTEKKNGTLYTVSPNYKPLKKLEVQPPKQFVRDPDDNSWRNESISSLGIVFNPKNSTKPFTQVLKNKTETEWNILLEKESNYVPDLRERLEKMAKIRKIKRKKTDSMGNFVYVDYEETSGSMEISSKEELTTSIPFFTTTSVSPVSEVFSTTDNVTTVPTDEPEEVPIDSTTTEILKLPEKERSTTKKSFNLPEYYESIDEDDIEYLNLAKIDLKKHVTEKQKVILVTPRTRSFQNQKVTQNNLPQKVRTVQYYPPLTTQKVNIDEYDNDFKFKLDSFTTKSPSTNVLPISVTKTTTPVVTNISPYTIPDRGSQKYVPIPNKSTYETNVQYSNKPEHKKTYAQHKNEYTLINDEGNFNRDTSIKNYGDFINQAAKDSDFDKNADFLPYTQPPIPSITVNDILKVDQDKDNLKLNEAFDYESQFRRDVIDRFVENFNRNSERFRPDFPVLFNSSIVHNDAHQDGRGVASSRSFLRGLYGSAATNNNYHEKPPYDPNCDNVTVELSPAYELHYYVPEQEEKEEAVAASVTIPFQYKL